MDCVLLGSGGMMPMPDRLLTSMVLRHEASMYLFDAGEAAQLGLKSAHLGLRGLDLIAVSHLHADHCLGIPGILMLRSQMREAAPLTILGPAGIQRFVENVHADLGFYLSYPLRFVEWQPGAEALAFDDGQLRIFWQPLQHGVTCLGYRVEEPERPGRFDRDRAQAAGVAEGTLWGRLQQGESVQLDDGRQVTPDEVLGPPRPGRVVAYAVDTRPCEGLQRLLDGADLAFIDAMFHPDEADHAQRKQHLTVAEAAAATRQAGARRTVLVHLSPRHDSEGIEALAAAAASEGPTVELGVDGARYEVPLRDALAPPGEG